MSGLEDTRFTGMSDWSPDEVAIEMGPVWLRHLRNLRTVQQFDKWLARQERRWR